jgi:hypothetical protein
MKIAVDDICQRHFIKPLVGILYTISHQLLTWSKMATLWISHHGCYKALEAAHERATD